MSNETKQRKVQIAVVKITKNEIDAALAAGNTHAKFTNRSVQKRLLKNQATVKREQERRENQIRQLNKHREKLAAQHEARLKREAEGEQLRQQAEAKVANPVVIDENAVANAKTVVIPMATDSEEYAFGVEVHVSVTDNPSVTEDGIVVAPTGSVVAEPENFTSSTEPTDISSKVAAISIARQMQNVTADDLESIAGINPFEMAPDGPRKVMYHGYAGTPPDLNKIATESLPERTWTVGEKGEKSDDDAAPDTTFALPA